jgi:regulator of ribonuclease activity A
VRYATPRYRGRSTGVKALGSNPRKSAKDGSGQVGVPVSFGDAACRPGPWLYSDEDGTIVAARRLT